MKKLTITDVDHIRKLGNPYLGYEDHRPSGRFSRKAYGQPVLHILNRTSEALNYRANCFPAIARCNAILEYEIPFEVESNVFDALLKEYNLKLCPNCGTHEQFAKINKHQEHLSYARKLKFQKELEEEDRKRQLDFEKLKADVTHIYTSIRDLAYFANNKLELGDCHGEHKDTMLHFTVNKRVFEIQAVSAEELASKPDDLPF